MTLKELLKKTANEALQEVLAHGAMPMDVLLVRVRAILQAEAPLRVQVPFAMVDAGLRLALDDGLLQLKNGKVGRPFPVGWHSWQVIGGP